MNSHNIDKGTKGEEMAAAFLVNKGYSILEKNYRFSHSEIDIICMHDQTLIFVEVKTRYSNKFGFPEQAVTLKKQKAIRRAAEHYIFENDWKQNLRFDVISIEKLEASHVITHFEDCFY